MKRSYMGVIRGLVLGMGMAVSLFAAVPLNGTLNLTSGTSTVEFLAVGKPGFLKIHGKTVTDEVKQPLKGELTVTNNKVRGTATYALNALDSGIGMRTEHMKKKYLQTAKYPTATVKITKLELPAELANDGASKEGIPFEGDLTLHGVTKPIKGTVTAEHKGSQLRLDFDFPLTLTDYNIDIPSFSGITVAKDVTVSVKTNTPLKTKANKG